MSSNLFAASFHGEDRSEVGCNMHQLRYLAKGLDAGDARAATELLAFQTLCDMLAIEPRE